MSSWPSQVLIAEDNPTDRLLLATLLRRLGLEVLEARDGEEAIALYEQVLPELVLLDVLMPRVDGLEAARRIRAMVGSDFVPIVFLTSLGDAESLARCLEAGGDDFLTKPYNSIVLAAKINALRRMALMHRTVQQQRDEISRHHLRMLQEQELAKRVFDKVAHAAGADPPNLRYSASPIAQFNGDVMLAAIGPGGQLVVLLGDFTGHGLSAAIGTLPLAQAFYTMVAKGFALREILRELNTKLYESLPVEVFCCAVMASFDLAAGRAEVWNGGLPDGTLYRAADASCHPLPSRHLPLGVVDASRFNEEPEIFDTYVGDRLFFWSDGILELRNSEGEVFGEERLASVFRDNLDPAMLFLELNIAVNQFLGEDAQLDDLSMLEVEIVPHESLYPVAATRRAVATDYRADWVMEYELRPGSIGHDNPLPLLVHILREVPPLRERAATLHTVLAELYNNALEHGLLGLDSGLKHSSDGFHQYYRERDRRLREVEDGFVRFRMRCRGDAHGGCLSITVTDSGDGILQPAGSDTAYAGRGLLLLERLCHRVDYNGAAGGVTVDLTWENPAPVARVGLDGLADDNPADDSATAGRGDG